MTLRAITLSLLLIPLASTAIQAANEEQDAIAAIEAAGGRVMKIAADTDDREIQFYLSDKEVTDEALKPVAKVGNVVWLNLRGTKITSSGVAHLKGLSGLTRLHLEGTQVDDDGLKYLSGLTKLEYLNLYGTKVSDAGLGHLHGLKNLKKLYLWQTEVTEQGAKSLQEKLPDTEIILGTKAGASS